MEHKTYTSLFSNPNEDPMGVKSAKVLLNQYNHDFRVQPKPLINNEMMLIVIENFKDQPVGGLATFTMERGELTLQILTGIRSYGRTPKNVGSPLIGKVFFTSMISARELVPLFVWTKHISTSSTKIELWC